MLQVEDIRELCKDDTIVLTDHFLARMRQRNIKWEADNSARKGDKQ